MINVAVHDLIKLKSLRQCSFDSLLPHWAIDSVKTVPYVVVRRGEIKQIKGKNYIPIGIRGSRRDERFGCFVAEDNCEDVITPQCIAEKKMWKDSRWVETLEELDERIKNFSSGLIWGPIGSVGFEVVTKHRASSTKSDLDIILKPNQVLTVEAAALLLNKLWEKPIETNGTEIDAIIQAKKGWVALSEFAGGAGIYLIKTKTGEELVKNIW